MNIQRHPACTMDLGAPSDMQDGSCASLPVALQQTPHGLFSISFWKPEPEELKVLNNGGSIILGVRALGREHPVVSLGVTTDKTEPA